MTKVISVTEISKHNSPQDVWIVVDGKVYDMTKFTPEHPGGAEIILRYAGRDASNAYNEVHAPSLIKKSLPVSKHLGKLDPNSITAQWLKPQPSVATASTPSGKPPLSTLINVHDFVEAARISLAPKTWAFYSSAATDLHSFRRNMSAYSDITLRPRVLIDVKVVDTRTQMLGQDMSFPIFCAPAAMARLVHPEGEKLLARGCQKARIPQCISSNASFPLQEIFESLENNNAEEGGYRPPIFFQLYVDKNRSKSEKLVAQAEKLGCKAIFLTVDSPLPGKREADERLKADESISTPMTGAQAKNDSKGGSLGRIMGGYIDPALCWDDIAWLRKHTSLPIILKGVMTSLDARRAMEIGVDGIVLSNHGGRNLDTAPAPVLVLLELQKNCPEVFDKMEVFVDGGITRGTDIFKALCIGARAVGIGRGFLYSLNYGEEGVEKFIEILRDELETTMRLMGITDLSQVHPGLVNTGAVDHLIPDGNEEHPYARWRPKARI
ncbi:FMN-dependent dehydrogenase-domain-containing protein [Xylogone sp. PMI_703]|nr:FMN-dependent dehydrogenase-domain-containing protein [Xylogone sp. PMI_703]